MTLPRDVARAAGGAAGAALSAATRGIAAVRPAAKPLHPSGQVVRGTLRRHGLTAPTTPSRCDWLDLPGTDDVVARLSGGLGLPQPLPDVRGLALRVPVGDGSYGDLLLATTGRGPVTRFVLVPRRDERSAMTTLLPYRTASGPVVLSATPTGDLSYELAWARGTGEWTTFADLDLSAEPGEDQDITFDPVVNQLPGLDQYPVVVRLREPSYRTARRSRS